MLIGRPQSPELLRLQNFLTRNASPHQVVDAKTDEILGVHMVGPEVTEPM